LEEHDKAIAFAKEGMQLVSSLFKSSYFRCKGEVDTIIKQIDELKKKEEGGSN
jgi:hypothetical protein